MGLNKTLLVGIIAGMGGIYAQAQAILRSFAPNASSYPFSTLQGAYQTSAGPAAVAVNDPIGLQQDTVGTNNATQTTAINRPTVQQDGNGRFYAAFNGTNSSLQLASVPFQTNDDFCVVACVKAIGFTGGGIFTLSTAGDTTAETMTLYFTSSKAALYIGHGGSNTDIQSTAYYADQTIVMTAWKVGTAIVLRVNSVQVSAGTWAGGTSIYTVCTIGKYPGLWLPHANYGVDLIKGTVTDAQLLVLEKAAAQRAGITI